MSHVLARLNGYGIQLVPHWPFRFEHVAGTDPEVVAAVRVSPEGDVRALVDARCAASVSCVVDVTREPSPDGWRVETSLFSVPWPEGFAVASPTDPDDRTGFYLLGPCDSAIFPQGPARTEALPAGNAWAGEGQRIIGESTLDDVYLVELAYAHEGRPWWQSQWLIPWGSERTLIFTAQAPAEHAEATRLAAEYLASEVWPTRGAN